MSNVAFSSSFQFPDGRGYYYHAHVVPIIAGISPATTGTTPALDALGKMNDHIAVVGMPGQPLAEIDVKLPFVKHLLNEQPSVAANSSL